MQLYFVFLLIASQLGTGSAASAAVPTAPPTRTPSETPSSQPSSRPSTPSSQPSTVPSSMPTIEEWEYQTTWDMNRYRKNGLCENHCSGHGSCIENINCECYKDLDGNPSWTGPDCSMRTCPKDVAWVAETAVKANNVHPTVECSNKGVCDRKTGTCECFEGYEGVACQRTVCPDDCNDRGVCWPLKHFASKFDRTYTVPWDSMKTLSCLCDSGFRGPSCGLKECPTGPDPLGGYGNEAARDCSGRGLCDYESGSCKCFTGFKGTKCETQTTFL